MREILQEIHPESYEHPFDAKALNALENTPGLDILIRKFWEFSIEKILRVQYTGSNLKVTKKSFPKVYAILEEACNNIFLPQKPDLYIGAGEGINALTTGIDNPLIMLHSDAVEELNDNELLFLIGREIGHIKSNHIMYYEIAEFLPIVGNYLGTVTLGIGKLVSTAVEMALYHWQRMSKFTCDRAGLLACQDLKVSISAMTKIAGLPKSRYNDDLYEDFITQAKEFKDYDFDTLSKVTKIFTIMWQTHPWTIMRASELLKWVESSEYDKIVHYKEYHKSTLEVAIQQIYCTQCGYKSDNLNKFCANCGYQLT